MNHRDVEMPEKDRARAARRRGERASQPSTKRAMTLYAIGALLGLGAAGYELLSAQGTQTREVPAENVALVNQQPILRSDFIAQVESETGLPFENTSRKDQLRVLDEMVDEELKVQRGLELNFAETDQDTRNALSNVVDQQMLVEVAIRAPSEQELTNYYDSHKAQYQTPGAMTVCDLLVADSNLDSDQLAERARVAVAALRSGNTLQQVVQRYGLVNKNNCENNFYFAIQIHLGEQLYEAAKKLATGAVSTPIRSGDGVHILQMINNTAPVPESYSDARDQVWGDYRTYREAQIRTGTMRFLRHRAKILIASDYSDYQLNAAPP
jgi:parvulin-like peptidyl-prolyl isomerase